MMKSETRDQVAPACGTILRSPTSVETIPLAQLIPTCLDHIARFRGGEENDPRFCLELFRRALDAHDIEAWHGLVELYQPLLRARLLLHGIAPDLAEDAVQEAFVTLWCKSDSGGLSTCDHTLPQVLHYLWGSVRFALIKLRRQQHDVPLVARRDPHPPLTPTGSEAVEQALDARALLARVRTLITAKQWRILWLRFGNELPPREIASLLGVPVAEIHLTLASVKRRLRTDFQIRSFIDADRQM